MLLNFYLVALFFILLIILISLNKKKKVASQETIIRSFTLLVLLHVFCLIIWLGTVAFAIFIGTVLLLSGYELSKHYRINKLWFGVVSLFFFAGVFYHHQLIELTIPLFIVISVLTFLASPTIVQHTLFLWVFSLGFLIPSSIFLIALMNINYATILVIVLLLQLNDAFGYLGGKKFGKTSLFKTISPNKTVEGYLFGGIGIILGILLLHTVIPILTERVFYQDFVLFFAILIFGNMGDLLLSSLKRKLDIKDFSNILPGHGGILDRFDNLFFVAPLYYLLFTHNLI